MGYDRYKNGTPSNPTLPQKEGHGMDPIALLKSNFDSFTKSEQKLARYLLDTQLNLE